MIGETRVVSDLIDPEDGLTAEERLGLQLISALEGRLVTDDTFRATERATNRLIAKMQEEYDAQRVLLKYNRRTWFQVMGYMVFGIAQLVSVSRVYDGVWFALAFPLVSHRGGPESLELYLRVLGVIWQVVIMVLLWRRSQVPAWLLDRVADGAMTEAEFLTKYPEYRRAARTPRR